MIDLLLTLAQENERNGDGASAEILYRGLLKDHPENPQVLLALGSFLLRRGAFGESAPLIEGALRADPTLTEAYVQLATLRQHQGQPERAMQALVIAAGLQSVKVAPHDIQTRFQLAMAFHQAERHREAGGVYRQALALQPVAGELYNNLGITLQNCLASAEALTAHRRAVALSPQNAAYHCNLAHALLAAGQLQEGFAEWEWRTPSPPRDFPQARWQGEPFAGKVLLAHAEQGYGDTLQFCRYLPQAAARGGRLVVECRAPLIGLLSRMPGVDAVVEWNQPLPDFDLQIAIPSLPFALDVDDARAVPPPYLAATAEHRSRWREKVGERTTGKVGVVWAGNTRTVDPKRALPPAELRRLADLPGITLFSLQRDGDQGPVREGMMADLGSAIADFDDLAGAIEALDLLISVDTAAAHLAGAMGKPVWTLLHAAPDWRWLPEATTSPWYPGMRLYRQDTAGDWAGVIARVADDLKTWRGPADPQGPGPPHREI